MEFRFFLRLVFALQFLVVSELQAADSLTLGILADREKTAMIKRYQPLVEYLNAQLKTVHIDMEILDFFEMQTAIGKDKLDLLFTNPRQFIQLQRSKKLTGAIASQVKRGRNGGYTQNMGGVIFTRQKNSLINELTDLQGKRVAFPGKKQMGSYQSQGYELFLAGINPLEDITLVETDGLEDVVRKVLSNQVDAGFVRTDILEDLNREGRLDLAAIKVINRRYHDDFPFLVSTRLYPEWPFVALSHVDRRTVSRIASILMALDENHPAAVAAGIMGFAPPADYHEVENVARTLRLPPFEKVPEVSWKDIWTQNQLFILFAILSIVVISFLLWLLTYRNLQLNFNRKELMDVLSSQDAILSAIPELMLELDMDGRYINVWARNPDELTATKSILLGKNVTEVLPREAAQIVLDALLEASDRGYSSGQQIYLPTGNGEAKWFELSTSLKTQDVTPYRFIMLSRDITHQKENEKQLHASQDRFRGLFENMADGVAIYRAVDDGNDFEFIDFNRAGEKIEGIKRENLLGKKVTEIFPGIKEMGLFELLQKVWRTGKAESLPQSIYQDDKLKGWRDNFIYRLETGEIVTIYSDETARKLAEQKLRESEFQQKLILQTVPDLMWLKDVEGVYLSCNPQFENFVGLPVSQIIGKTDYDLMDLDLADSFRDNDKSAMLANNSVVTEEWLIFANDGHKALLELTNIPFKTDEEKIIGVLGTGHDITERNEAAEAQRLASSVFTHSQEGIVITDVDNCIIDVNPACFRLTGYSRHELLGQNPKILSSGSHSAEFYQQMWEILNEQGHWQGEVLNRKKSGEVYTERLSINVVNDEKGQIQHYVGVFSDISHLKEQEQKLQRVAYSDALTGLPNRLLLHDRMSQAINQAERHKKMVAVCYLDLDGFKEINDQHGHNAGDEVLVEVASRLKKVLRQEDSVARLGGDEFVLLMVNLNSAYELEELADRVLTTIANPYFLTTGQPISISASIGIAMYPQDDNEPDTLLRHADQAMYAAKKRGKNQHSFFDPSEELNAIAVQGLQEEIKQSIKNEEFKLFYQPKVNMRTGEIIGAEALIRWMHPTKGMLNPVEFLPHIEHSNLIIEVGNWVLRKALRQIKEWLDSGLKMSVSVNVSALQLQQDNFVSSLKSMLDEFPEISATQLELEILETAALHEINHVSEIISQCGEMGIEFALDDFGTGYSSLTYLKRLPAKMLKIDQSFIQDILDDPDDIAITEGILSLTRAFNRIPIAEGVETVRHGSFLLSMGCELAQGYGIALPMPADELPAWVQNFELPEEWKQIPRVDNPEVDISLMMMAIEHHQLISRVLTAIKNNQHSMLPEYVHDAHHCKFGIWLDTEGMHQHGQKKSFEKLLKNHNEIHQICNLAEQNLTKGNSKELLAISEKLKALRNNVLENLSDLGRK